MGKLAKRFHKLLTNDKKRLDVQHSVLFVLLCVVASVMTVINILTHKGALTWVTGAFAVLCLVNLLLHRRGGAFHSVAVALFFLEVFAMFTFFLITGNPDGFSALWIAMLPSFGLLMYRRKIGTLFSLVPLLMLLFFFWTPLGRSLLQYDYTDTFRMRFPVLYVAFFALAFFLETIREATYQELVKAKDKYAFLHAHDALTGAYNRHGFMKLAEEYDSGSGALAMLDVDMFKRINDAYGHDRGDAVLKELARILHETAPDEIICRWGGDEFVILFRTPENAEAICKKLLEKVRAASVDADGEKIEFRICIGLAYGEKDKPFDVEQLMQEADKKLYEAKTTGKDKFVV